MQALAGKMLEQGLLALCLAQALIAILGKLVIMMSLVTMLILTVMSLLTQQ